MRWHAGAKRTSTKLRKSHKQAIVAVAHQMIRLIYIPLCRRQPYLDQAIGMEACSGAHHWARLFQALGHTVKLMAPKFVALYRLCGKRGKNDAAYAEPGHDQSCGLFVPGEGPGRWSGAPCKGRRSVRRCSGPTCASFRPRAWTSRAG